MTSKSCTFTNCVEILQFTKSCLKHKCHIGHCNNYKTTDPPSHFCYSHKCKIQNCTKNNVNTGKIYCQKHLKIIMNHKSDSQLYFHKIEIKCI